MTQILVRFFDHIDERTKDRIVAHARCTVTRVPGSQHRTVVVPNGRHPVSVRNGLLKNREVREATITRPI